LTEQVARVRNAHGVIPSVLDEVQAAIDARDPERAEELLASARDRQ
jgi:hypothetical protein